MKKFFLACFLFCIIFKLFSQEVLLSGTERYYDFLALRGLTERPYLNYRTLSDSKWRINDQNHPWQDQKLLSEYHLAENIFARVYGPEIFASYNTAFPYGQNDGALWQGKGFNLSASAGVRFEGYGFEVTIKPQLVFSQNREFKILPSNYSSPYGYFWGYGFDHGVDAPQRFGDKAFSSFDLGDTEIRYTWKTLTAGFGTQAIWLGPAYLNPILHSNNAPSYPKFDIGLRRQPVTIPWVNWYAGDVEFRIWVGYLSESNYFDSKPSNDHSMFHGLTFSYAPSFLSGLTLSANRVSIIPWELKNLKKMFPTDENSIEDQKASFGLSYLFPQVGFELFGEFGVDDYTVGGLKGYISYPISTLTYNVGFKKTIPFSSSKKIYGEIIFEFDWLEMSQNYQLVYPYTFYFHHQAHGYTNKGQWMANASSPGGNSQYLRFELFYPKGNTGIFVSRNNPDNNYIYKFAADSAVDPDLSLKMLYFKSNLNFGVESGYFILPSVKISAAIIYNYIINPYYDQGDSRTLFERIHNFSFNVGLNITF
jgi:hypothetical protein